MVLRTATKDEGVPRPRTLIMVRERLISIVVWFRRPRTASACGVFLDGLFPNEVHLTTK